MRQDTLLARVHGPTLRFAKAIGLVLAPTAIVVFGFTISSCMFSAVLPVELGTNLAAARKACDRAVETLLASRDPIELQRSGILIHELDCSVSRRLPKEP